MTADDGSRHEHVFKLLVTGPFAAGKSSLIRSVSQTAVVETEVATSGDEARVKAHTTVAMDFGTYATADGRARLLLFGTPGQERFTFMTEILQTSVDAVIYVVDAAATETHLAAGGAMRRLLRDLRVPLVVAVNRCDDEAEAQLIARQLGCLASEVAVPCQLIERESGRGVVVEALLTVSDGMERGVIDSREPIERVLALAAA